MKSQLIIGTRPSKLALWQAEHVQSLLATRFGINTRLEKITTKGDKILDRSLVEIGGKGLFLKEIEDALLEKRVDLAVHSMKDVPHTLPDGLTMVATLEREDPADAWLSREGLPIQNLPAGAIIGTTSLRRKIQLQKLFPQLEFRDLRGNVDTRIAKLKRGEFDGIVLAMAGLKRLGLAEHITHPLDIVSAVGQGAVGVECRADDAEIVAVLQKLNHEPTSRTVALERAYLKKVQGSCQTPLGCRVSVDPKDPAQFVMRCFLAEPDGSAYSEKTVTGRWEDGEKIVAGL